MLGYSRLFIDCWFVIRGFWNVWGYLGTVGDIALVAGERFTRYPPPLPACCSPFGGPPGRPRPHLSSTLRYINDRFSELVGGS
jgi:hypothetical protein